MQKKLAVCEDGRTREARVHGIERQFGNFKIFKAGIRIKGKHVQGEAWRSLNTGTWYFLTDPECKHCALLPRILEKPDESSATLKRSHNIR